MNLRGIPLNDIEMSCDFANYMSNSGFDWIKLSCHIEMAFGSRKIYMIVVVGKRVFNHYEK